MKRNQTEITLVKYLLKSISIRGNLQLLSSEENMSQKKKDALSIEESTVTDDRSDSIVGNQVKDMSDASEIDASAN